MERGVVSVNVLSVFRNRTHAMAARIRSRLMVRSMIAIIGISGLAGLIVLSATHVALVSYERDEVMDQVRDTVQATEATARTAAYEEDPSIAHNVAEGLLENPVIGRVVIKSPSLLLVDLEHTPHIGHELGEPIIRDLILAVDGTTTGFIAVYPDVSRVRAASERGVLFFLWFLGFELFVVGGAVAWVVYGRVTRPIRHLANELHALDLENGSMLQLPYGNESDEIGRLVTDLNFLVARMQGLLLAERELRLDKENSERQYRLIFENAETGIFVLGADGRLVSWNPAMARMLSETGGTSGGKLPKLATVLGCEEALMDDLIAQAVAQDAAVSVDFERQFGDCESQWFQVAFNPVTADLLQGVCNDVTERKRAEARVRALADCDALTGLLNRRGFEVRAQALLRTAHPSRALALLLIDLDGFKAVNDSMGHEAGDEVLKHVMRVLESSVRKSDIVGRFGGDEFVVMLDGCESGADAALVADKIIQRVHKPVDVGVRGTALVGASVGIAMVRRVDSDFSDVVRQADEAMYAAKRAGKNTFRLWEHGMGSEH